MSKKQGGNGKTSSPSDQAYWKRIQNAGGKSRRKLANIAKAQKAKGYRFPLASDYGRPGEKLAGQFVTFSGPVKDQRDPLGVYPLHIVKCDGKILEISPKQSDAIDAISKIAPGLPYVHTLLNPISGKNTLVTSRGFQ